MNALHDGTSTEIRMANGAGARAASDPVLRAASDPVLRAVSEPTLRAVSDEELAGTIRLVAQRLRRLGPGMDPATDPATDRDPDPLMTLVTTTLAYALEARARLLATRERLAELERLSVTDELTGLLNRRGFEDRLRQELAAAQRSGDGGVLVFIDLDGFKAINDTLGHAAGDEVLRQVAALLRANVRESDILGRLGGDEFVVLMPRSPAHHGLLRAMRVETILNGSCATWQGQAIVLRASCGTSAFDPGTDWRRVMREADLAMYAKKQDARSTRTGRGTRTSDPAHPAAHPAAFGPAGGDEEPEWTATAYV